MKINVFWRTNRSKKKDKRNTKECYLIQYPPKQKPVTDRLEFFKYINPRTEQQTRHNRDTDFEVEQYLAKRRNDYRLGLYDMEDYKKTTDSFVLWCRSYIERRSVKLNANSISPYKLGVDLFEQYFDKAKTLVDFTKEQSEDFQQWCITKAVSRYRARYSETSVNTYWNRLKLMCDAYIQNGNLTNGRKNMFLEVGYLETKDKKREYINLDEYHSLDVSKCIHQDIARAFMFSFLTGLRTGDIELLKYKDVQKDQKEGYFTEVLMQKTNELIRIPLGEEEMQLIGEIGADKETIFRYTPAAYKYLYNWLKNAYPDKKVSQTRSLDDKKEGLTFHSARASFITNMLNEGIPAVRVQKYVGHKDLKTTLGYYRGAEEMEAQDFGKFKEQLRATKGIVKAKQLIS